MTLLVVPPACPKSQWVYLVLGKALYVASSFESDCRSLAFVLKILEPQENEQSEDEVFKALSKAVLGQLAAVGGLIAQRVSLPADDKVMFDAAREARNYIAHDAFSEFDRLKDLPDGLERWRDVISSKLDDIAYGKIIIAVHLSRRSAAQIPTTDAINTYSGRMKSWVLRDEN